MVVTSFHPEDKWLLENLDLDDIEDAAQQQRIQSQIEQERKEKQERHPEILEPPQ